jgi:mannitol-1-/sugar-/sorbitol-6-phosphatase
MTGAPINSDSARDGIALTIFDVPELFCRFVARLDSGATLLGMRAFVCETQGMSLFVRQAILFDLDGVLVDSTTCAGRIWKAWAREQELDPERMVQMAHGRPTIETIRMVAPHLDAHLEAVKIEEREVNDVDGLKALPGAKDLLTSLPADRYAIVTSGSRRLATARLQAADLPVPARMITADDITKGKPDPEPYLTGARLLGYKPQDCLVFEDAPAGIRAAKAAGITVVAFPTTYPLDALSEADFVAESLGAVLVEVVATGELELKVATLQPCPCP